MNLFFDTEFTGLKKNTNLISIGIVAENGKRFYAENCRIITSISHMDKWIEENVIKNTAIGGNKDIEKSLLYDPNTTVILYSDIRTGLEKYLSQFDKVQFVSDVCHYDFVLLIDIFGDAFDLPSNVSPVCYDINQDIARWYKISQAQAFDKSREDIMVDLYGKNIIKGYKHNALYDAEVIKAIYDFIVAK